MSRKIKKSILMLEIKNKIKVNEPLVKEKCERERRLIKIARVKWLAGKSKKHLIEKSRHIGGIK